MILLKRFLPFATVVCLCVLFECIVAFQTVFWILFPLIALVAIVPVGILVRWDFHTSDFWRFVVPSAGLVGSTVFLMMFLDQSSLIQLFLLATSLLIGWYCENVFHYYYQPGQYQPYALEHISLYLALLTIFYLFSALYAARIFLSIPMVYLFLVGGVVLLIFSAQLCANLKIPLPRAWKIVAAMTLVLLELFVGVSLLPTTFFVAGLLIAIPYYLMMNIIRHAVRQTLTAPVILRNVAVGVVVLTITLLTAPWV
jgi:hypothetical protein